MSTRAPERRAGLARLAERGELLAATVDGMPGRAFFLRAADLPALDTACSEGQPSPRAALIAPLDNLIWDRDLARRVFGFDYAWEVYKPAAQRKFGYYVLPVLYGDHFVARCEPAFDKKARVLALKNWWWEESVEPLLRGEAMGAALANCLHDFMATLGAEQLVLGEPLRALESLWWAKALQA